MGLEAQHKSFSLCPSQILSQNYYYFFLLFVLLLAFDLSTSFTLKHYVLIINHLNEPLDYHCKSKNDDLGIWTLQPNGEWKFSFQISWVAVTEFYCCFWYDNFQATFDAFKDGGLYEQCGGEHCIWTVQEDGFYLYSIKLGYNVKMHYWSNKWWEVYIS